jgi:hypothetical protein
MRRRLERAARPACTFGVAQADPPLIASVVIRTVNGDVVFLLRQG